MKQRVITAALILAVVIPPLIFGGVFLDVLIAIAMVMAVYEFTKVMESRTTWLLIVTLSSFVLLQTFSDGKWYNGISLLLLIVLFVISILDKNYNIMKISYLFTFTCLISLGIRSFIHIYSFGYLAMAYVLIATYLTDTFAYFGGMAFGRHKLIERISPKKTVEGSVIGYLGGALSSLAFGWYFLDFPLQLIVLGSLIMPIISQIGDLAMSSVKRYFNCKDFSNIFPGHGGVLDRIDSLLFSLLVFNLLIKVMLP